MHAVVNWLWDFRRGKPRRRERNMMLGEVVRVGGGDGLKKNQGWRERDSIQTDCNPV